MFTQFSLQNYRSHRNTLFNIDRVALLIGPNSAGKTNILRALGAFSNLVRQSRPSQGGGKALDAGEFTRERYKLAQDSEPLKFGCQWRTTRHLIDYEFRIPRHGAVHEKMLITKKKGGKKIQQTIEAHHTSAQMGLQWEIDQKIDDEEGRNSVKNFFSDLSSIYYFAFEPSALRHLPSKADIEGWDEAEWKLLSLLRMRGEGLHGALHLIHTNPRLRESYERFRVFMEEFDENFRDVVEARQREHAASVVPVAWKFNLRRDPPKYDHFGPSELSDGFLRAAAIAFLTSVKSPPALILIDEIENGIGRDNLRNLIRWMRLAADFREEQRGRSRSPQFLITSHNPGVIREFADRPIDVIHVFRDRRTLESRVRDLNSILCAFIDSGTIEGDIADQGGARTAVLEPDKLIQLWYQGLIGGRVETSSIVKPK